MQLAITVMGDVKHNLISEIIRANANNQCRVVDLKSSIFSDTQCAYFLVEGNWNQLAKYESTLHAIQKKHDCSIHCHRIEKLNNVDDLPIAVEVIGLESSELLNNVILFFNNKSIIIEETIARRYPAPYLNAQLISARFVVTLAGESLFQIRDELMYLCDQLNADLIFEPFKMSA
jgi:glycine cleavage system transcriptional repressor